MNYVVTIVGPGLDSAIVVREAADLEAVRLMLAKVEKQLTNMAMLGRREAESLECHSGNSSEAK